MQVRIVIRAAPNELRRLGGQPDLVPMLEAVNAVLDRWLIARLEAARDGQESPLCRERRRESRT